MAQSKNIQHNPFSENRVGKFYINDDLLHMTPETAMLIFSHVAIVQAQHLPYAHHTEYIGYSPLFEKVDFLYQPPTYIFKFEAGEEGPLQVIGVEEINPGY